ncbi:alkaline phosphatase family protein [Proteiniborus sp. MB09-C3]|uniref:LTA synthase family protein n=1 Tax=Proteiniborus sp. MB09-C3 TaxID=3050072 RepID=UPI002556AB33|nr:alkaline phosphatase family protein [Proteiniborus sp. MB09-C3]WIV11294.1 sulfatase-like hydrolase/transferase [Proteiniborus sp. MB09-C3]
MIRINKDRHLLFYYILSLFFMEFILRISIVKNFFSSGLIFTLLFTISMAALLFIICSSFSDKINYILSSVFLGILAFIFSSQLIYYKFFRTFYTAYSLGNGSQVLEFWRDILILIFRNVLWIILFFAPVILIIVLGQKLFCFRKIEKSYKFSLMYFTIFLHIMSLEAIYINGTDENSAYDLYFNSNYPVLSVEKLGLVTTVRLDFQRLISGWSPSLKASATELTYSSSEKSACLTYEKDPTLAEFPTPIAESDKKLVGEEKIEYNIIDIDFELLMSKEENKAIKDMHEYFKNEQPTKKNEYTGKYKGYNLILITAEGFSHYAVNKDVTPTLYKLVNEGYNFTNFYNPIWGVSTSDGEYVACTGLIPKSGVWSFYHSGKNHMPFVMGNQLKKLDYKTVAYHNHTYTYYKRDVSHPNMGYDYKGVGNGLDVKKTWPESDLEMMEKTIPEYISNQPFHAYYMTVSGHMQYNFFGNYISSKNKEYVKDLPYFEEGKAYIAAQIELDRALEYLLSQLEEAGIADKTLIVLSADHYPYGLKDDEIDNLAGHEVEKNFELYKSAFILYTKGMKPVIIDRPCSSLDIIPTISNLLGLEYDSRLLMGKDIFSDSEPLVIFSNRSFITDKGNYNSLTKEFTPVDGIEIEEGYVKSISSIVRNKFYYSAKILETDYYGKVFEK